MLKLLVVVALEAAQVGTRGMGQAMARPVKDLPEVTDQETVLVILLAAAAALANLDFLAYGMPVRVFLYKVAQAAVDYHLI
jgi:hypothetical protein